MSDIPLTVLYIFYINFEDSSCVYVLVEQSMRMGKMCKETRDTCSHHIVLLCLWLNKTDIDSVPFELSICISIV